MNYHVELTTSAKTDVRAILSWIESRSRSGADAWSRRLDEILDLLSEAAEPSSFAPENEDHSETIRQVVFKTRRGRPYRLLFIIRETTVFILHIRGPGQDLIAPDDLQLPG